MVQLRYVMRIALRQLLRRPGFAVTAVLSIALGIALNAMMAALVDGLRNPRVRFSTPETLFMMVYHPGEGGRRNSAIVFETIRDRARSLAGVADYRIAQEPVTTPSGVEQREVTQADGSFFRILGSPAASGRLSPTTEEVTSGETVAVLSTRFARRFADNPAQLRAVTVGGVARRVVGTVDLDAAFPRTSDVWLLRSKPLVRSPMLLVRSGGASEIASLQSGLEPVRRELDALTNPGGRPGRWYLQRAVASAYDTPAFVLAVFAATIALLFIAAANLATLQLARVVRTRNEFALRAVLGAGRRQLAVAASAEILLVGAIGLVLGMLLSVWGLTGLDVLMPTVGEYAVLAGARLSFRVVGFAAGVTVFATLLIALVPAFVASRETHLASNPYSRSTKAVARAFRGLVTVETALSLALLTASGVLLRAAWTVIQVDWGYDTAPLVTAELRIPVSASPGSGGRTVDSVAAHRLLDAALSDARGVPGVRDATLLRYGSPVNFTVTTIDAGGQATEKVLPHFRYQIVTSNMLRLFAIPIARGRGFTASDDARGTSAIIDEATANFFWPSQDPIGRRIRLGGLVSDRPWYDVVGVSKTALFGVSEAVIGPSLAIFIAAAPLAPVPGVSPYSARLVYRSANVNTTLPALQRLSTEPPAGVTLVQPQRWDDFTGLSRVRTTHVFVLIVFAGFAVAGLLLTIIGLYGVLSFMVASRSREFGLRLAVGAPTRVLALEVLRDGLRPVMAGAALGLVLSLWSNRLLRAFLFDTDAIDPLVFFGAVVLIAITATVACWLPARRATTTDLSALLRAE